jgi:hypothetical protein
VSLAGAPVTRLCPGNTYTVQVRVLPAWVVQELRFVVVDTACVLQKL